MPAGMLSRTSSLQRTVTHAHRMTPALQAALHASLHAGVISSLYYTLPVAQALSLSSLPPRSTFATSQVPAHDT